MILTDHHDDVGLAIGEVGELLEIVATGVFVQQHVLPDQIPSADGNFTLDGDLFPVRLDPIDLPHHLGHAGYAIEGRVVVVHHQVGPLHIIGE